MTRCHCVKLYYYSDVYHDESRLSCPELCGSILMTTLASEESSLTTTPYLCRWLSLGVYQGLRSMRSAMGREGHTRILPRNDVGTLATVLSARRLGPSTEGVRRTGPSL